MNRGNRQPTAGGVLGNNFSIVALLEEAWPALRIRASFISLFCLRGEENDAGALDLRESAYLRLRKFYFNRSSIARIGSRYLLNVDTIIVLLHQIFIIKVK